MAKIKEELVLQDSFSAAFSRYITLGQKAAGASTLASNAARNYQSVANSLDRKLISLNAQFSAGVTQQQEMIRAGQQGTAAFAQLDAKLEKLGGTIRDLEGQYNALAPQAERAATETKKFSQENDKARSSSSGLLGTIRNLAGAYLGMRTVSSLVNLADSYTQTNARLEMITGSQEEAVALNNMIYESAQRSRGAYQETADMVAKLGTLAGDAFNGSGEIVDFAEQLNKQMAISGTSNTGRQAAMLQLTQAMSSGVLRGEELNTILEQTPTIAKSIAEYMGVSTGKMRELASEGAITADVVKNALFNAAEETNEKFKQMPLTWGQAWTMAQNMAIRALQPVLTGINWVVNNLDLVAPVVLTAGAAFAVFVTAANWTNICTGATNLLTTAQRTLTTVMKTGWAVPLLVIIAVVGAIYLVTAAVNHFTDTSVSATGIIAGSFTALTALVFNNTLVPLQNGFAAFVNFIGNVFTDPVTAIKVLFYDMALTVLGYIRSLAGGIEDLINAIPGVEVNLTGGINSLYNTLQSNRQAAIDAGSYTEFVKAWQYQDLGDAFGVGYNAGANFNPFGSLMGGGAGSTASFSPFSEIGGSLDNIADNVGSIEKSVNMSEEDLKSLVDVAERRYVNNINLTAQSPVINVIGQNTGNTQADRMNLANTIRDILIEQVAAGSTVNTSTVLF